MPDTFDIYDKSAIEEPNAVVERLLGQADDDVHSLAVSDCFDLEDGDEEQFNEALVTLNRDFEIVLAKLSQSLGNPNYSGATGAKEFPPWAGTGHRVAFWNTRERIVYLHITHVGSVAPVELNLGVVTGPPKNWAVGT